MFIFFFTDSLLCSTMGGQHLHFYLQRLINWRNCRTFLLFGVMDIASSKGQQGCSVFVLLRLKSAMVMRNLRDCLPNSLNPHHNRQTDSRLYPIPLPFLCLISWDHLPLSLLLVHSQGPFPACTHQQHRTSEHMGKLHNLQHDGCDITFDTIIAACFTTEAHQASFPSPFAF